MTTRAERATRGSGGDAEPVGPGPAEPPGASSHPWDGYLTGPENELAMAAAQSLARGEGQVISPLLVYGPSGAGKSRLLAGLVAERMRRRPGSAVAHLDAETFAAACAEASGDPADGGWSALRERFRGVDLFVLEDLEGLERAPPARDELGHTLDSLESAGAAVAVSARAAPGSWSRREWPSRLVNRLIGGLVARIDPPGLASRRRYLLQQSGRQGLPLHAETVEKLAGTADGYRTLDGWITRLAMEAQLRGGPRGRGGGRDAGRAGGGPRTGPAPGPLDPDTVADILADETTLADSPMTIDAIARSVAARFGVGLGVMRGPSRRASVVAIRHIAMHLARSLTGSSFAAIGTYFGGRDPATVRHACQAAADRLHSDPSLAAAVATIGRGSSKTEM